VISNQSIVNIRKTVQHIRIEDNLLKFIADLVHSTRNHKMIELGGSPRASLSLMQASKAMAAISGRDFVIPEDIKAVGLPILRHRIILTPEAEMEGITEDELLTRLFTTVEIPR
jgi:MoxR-like ATPase